MGLREFRSAWRRGYWDWNEVFVEDLRWEVFNCVMAIGAGSGVALGPVVAVVVGVAGPMAVDLAFRFPTV